MNSIEAFRHYKHDIVGKFRDVSMAINNLNENSFNEPEANEIFHAVHEVILKMLLTSRNTIHKKLNQKIELVVIDEKPNTSLPAIKIEGITIRYELSETLMKYVYSKSENNGSVESHLESLKLMLPFRDLNFDGRSGIQENFLKKTRD
jgi:hypothetical protein